MREHATRSATKNADKLFNLYLNANAVAAANNEAVCPEGNDESVGMRTEMLL